MTSGSSASPIQRGQLLILDSWPVLEWLHEREPTLAAFRALLESARSGELQLFMSRMNAGEVSYKIVHYWGKQRWEEIRSRISVLPIQIVSVDDALVDEAAALKSIYPISYADCFAAALAIRYAAPVVTGDPDFKRLANLGVLELKWLGA